MAKQYSDPQTYEAKLEKAMTRLGVDSFVHDWSRRSCWIEFFNKGQPYRFEHSVENANAHGIKIQYGSDVFAQVVLSLEDLARMVERGIYYLIAYISGMKCLPKAKEIPKCFAVLQFSSIPTEDELKSRFHQLSNRLDGGGSEEQFITLKNAYDELLSLLRKSDE